MIKLIEKHFYLILISLLCLWLATTIYVNNEVLSIICFSLFVFLNSFMVIFIQIRSVKVRRKIYNDIKQNIYIVYQEENIEFSNGTTIYSAHTSLEKAEAKQKILIEHQISHGYPDAADEFYIQRIEIEE